MKSKALALAALTVLAMMAAPAAATVSVDTSSSDSTSSTSELTDGDTIEMDGTPNASETYTVQGITSNNSTELGFKIAVNDTDRVTYRNESLTNVTASGSHSEGSHYNATFDQTALADVAASPNENVTLDATFYNMTDESVNTTFQIHLENSANRSVIFIGGDEDDDELTVNEDNGTEIWGTDYTYPLTADDWSSAEFDATTTEKTERVIYVYGDDTVAEDFSEAASEADDEDWIVSQAAFVSGTPVKVYNDEAPSDVDADETTHGVYGSVGGEDATTFHLSEDDRDDEEVTVRALGNHQYGRSLWQLYSAFGDIGDASTAFSISSAS
jgi:hypothetical protein